MSEELRLLLGMKRTTRIILLLVGFLTGSCILHLAIITGKFDLDKVDHYVGGKGLASPDNLWSVIKPAPNQEQLMAN